MQKPQGELLALASDPIGTKPGERVEVEPSVGHSIGLSVLVFAIPCVFLVLGYLAGWWVFCPPCGSTAGSPAARSRSLSSCATRRKAVGACSAMSGLSGRN